MEKLNHIEILGGGPAGLYTAILLRRKLPNVSVRVTEKNPKGATFGFGVVFTDRALDFLKRDDQEMYDLITPHMERWSNMTLAHQKEKLLLDGLGLMSIGRLELIEIMRKEAESLGVDIQFNTVIKDIKELKADLIIGADGVNSLMRNHYKEEFQPKIENFSNRFAWFGASIPFETLTQTFVQTDKGPLNSHHYRYAPNRSTFIVECEEETFNAYGFANMNETDSAALCSEIFRDTLKGTTLITNKSIWRQFPRLWCEKWVSGRHVILGDAAHTAHFSVGSGTRLALEDAIALVDALAEESDVDQALANFQDKRLPIAKKIVDAANTSATWYETFGNKMTLPSFKFAYDYLGRTGRMDDERLRKIVPKFMAAYDKWQMNGKV